MDEQQDYLEFLIEECEEYIKEFETLKESVLGDNIDFTEGEVRVASPRNNIKLKNQKARLQKEFMEACLQIEQQKKEIEAYERKFDQNRKQIAQFDKEIHEKEQILANLNKQLKG